ncbi:MAG: hypothetical protein HYV05_13095 [Deltaproteobacteria bacterium]|nr:hypothetical protein [Deltaproteobacteria bacterium]
MTGMRRSLARFWLLGVLSLSPGCAESDLRLPSPPLLSFEELKQKVSRLRELPFLQEISVETRSLEEIQALLENSLRAGNKREDLEQRAEVYARLGLLPERTDLAKTLLGLRLLHRPVLPDARRGTIFLPKAPPRPALTLLGLSSGAEETTKQLLTAYALSYILQEQHFDWEEKIRNGTTEDARLALRALRDGDAALVALAHLMGDSKENRQKVVGALQGLSRLPARLDKELFEFPELLRRKVAFQYLQGSKFVAWAYTLKGWEGVNSLFRHPPVSTEQLLHPEKYYVKRDEPVRVVPWALIRRFEGKKVLDETLGEFFIQTLLSRALSEGEARQAAAGWAGDTLLAFRPGRALLLGWITAWDSPEEAGEFHAGFVKALERRHGVSLRPPPGHGDLLTAALPGGRALLLQLREQFVFFLDGISPPFSLNIAEEIWSDLETGAEAEPPELTRRNRHSLPPGK